MVLHAQGAVQMGIADEDESEQRLGGEVQAEQDDRDHAVELGDCFFKQVEVGGPPTAWLDSEFAA